MKKVLATLLALVMVLSFAACGDKDNNGGTSTPTDNGGNSQATTNPDAGGTTGSTKAYPNCNEDGSINLDKIAHFDREYDYTKNEKFKVAYLAAESGPLYQQAAVGYEHWAKMFNLEWAGFVSSNGDSDLYLTTLQNLIDTGVRGFILDPDSTIFPAVAALLENYPEVQWMSQMSAPRDGATGDGVPAGGNMIHPYVGFDNTDAGVQQMNKLIEWKNENLADVDWSEIGVISFDYSVSPPLHERTMGVQNTYEALVGNLDNFYVVDCVSTGINLQGGMDAVSPVISTHGEYKYWLVAAIIDDWAQAAATVIDQQGLTDNSCVVDFGGAALQKQWDAGQQDAYRFALFTDNNLYSEPILGAVYAFLNGWATPDTIWPSWINYNDCGADGHTYPQLRLPTVWLEPDTYQHYLEWADMYAGANSYNYSQEGISIDDYSPYVDEIPANYAKQN